MSGPSDPATTQTPAPGPTPSRTVSPPVLQQRTPSIRYIDAKQSDAIMESGTKSASVSRLPAAAQCYLLYQIMLLRRSRATSADMASQHLVLLTFAGRACPQRHLDTCIVTLNWLACNCGRRVGGCSCRLLVTMPDRNTHLSQSEYV